MQVCSCPHIALLSPFLAIFFCGEEEEVGNSPTLLGLKTPTRVLCDLRALSHALARQEEENIRSMLDCH